jgi:hypothetical protein
VALVNMHMDLVITVVEVKLGEVGGFAELT